MLPRHRTHRVDTVQIPVTDSARSAVVSDATGPSTCLWARNASMSLMSVPPTAIEHAMSASTRPRSCSVSNPGLASTRDKPPVNPDRSANIRRLTAPAIATTSAPSAANRRSLAHPVNSRTSEVPSSTGTFVDVVITYSLTGQALSRLNTSRNGHKIPTR